MIDRLIQLGEPMSQVGHVETAGGDAAPDDDAATPPPRMRLLAQGSALLRAPMVPVLIVTFLLFCLTVDGFTSAANLSNMARLFAPLLIASIGATFVFLLGGIDLSIGSTLSLASVIGASVDARDRLGSARRCSPEFLPALPSAPSTAPPSPFSACLPSSIRSACC